MNMKIRYGEGKASESARRYKNVLLDCHSGNSAERIADARNTVAGTKKTLSELVLNSITDIRQRQ